MSVDCWRSENWFLFCKVVHKNLKQWDRGHGTIFENWIASTHLLFRHYFVLLNVEDDMWLITESLVISVSSMWTAVKSIFLLFCLLKRIIGHLTIGIGRLSADADYQMADTDYRQTGRQLADTDYRPIIGAPVMVINFCFNSVFMWWRLLWCFCCLHSTAGKSDTQPRQPRLRHYVRCVEFRHNSGNSAVFVDIFWQLSLSVTLLQLLCMSLLW